VPKKKYKNIDNFLGAIFVKSKHVQQFCEGLHIFCTKFLRFCPDFHQLKTFGGAVAPQSRRHGGLLGAYPPQTKL